MNKIESPVKLKIRTDGHVIRAWFALTDGSSEFEVSTLNIDIANNDPSAFEDWKEALIKIHCKWTESVIGEKVIECIEKKPHDPHIAN